MKLACLFAFTFALLPIRAAHADVADDVGTEMLTLMNDLAAIAIPNQNDCVKMGDKLEAYSLAHRDAVDKMIARGKAFTADEKKAFGLRYGDRLSAAGAKMQPAMTKCYDKNAKVGRVMGMMSKQPSRAL